MQRKGIPFEDTKSIDVCVSKKTDFILERVRRRQSIRTMLTHGKSDSS